MADTKVSALTAAASALDTHEIPVNESGTSKKVTRAQLFTAPTFGAGSATAGSWPKFTAGTLMTTAEDGAIEMDGEAFYLTHDAGNRALIHTAHVIRQDSTYTLTSTTTAQQVFNASTNGRITLETGAYVFEALIALTSMSATSGNATFDFTGTATFGTILWYGMGRDAAADAATGTFAGSYSTDATLVTAPLVTAATTTAAVFKLEGTFEVTAAGTFQLRILLQTAAAAVVSAGSYLMVRRIGSTSLTTVGQWD